MLLPKALSGFPMLYPMKSIISIKYRAFPRAFLLRDLAAGKKKTAVPFGTAAFHLDSSIAYGCVQTVYKNPHQPGFGNRSGVFP
jgi:hypothetical protein